MSAPEDLVCFISLNAPGRLCRRGVSAGSGMTPSRSRHLHQLGQLGCKIRMQRIRRIAPRPSSLPSRRPVHQRLAAQCSTSCMGMMQMFATERAARADHRPDDLAVMLKWAADTFADSCADFTRVTRHQPSVVLLSCVPV